MSNLWDRLPDENEKQYLAFKDYCRLGISRSLSKLIKKYRSQNESKTSPVIRLATAKEWSSTFNWVARAESWDKSQEEKRSKEWEKRRIDVIEADYKQAEDLRKLARRILSKTNGFLTRSQRVIEGVDGQPIKVIIKEKIDMGLAVRAIEAASKLQRLSGGLETNRERLEHTGANGGSIKFDGLSDSDVDEILASAEARAKKRLEGADS